jgi:limonene-1,2-epoxide hydrolase
MTHQPDFVRRGLLTTGGLALAGAAFGADVQSRGWTTNDFTPEEKTNVKVVDDLFRALQEANLEAHIACFAPDARVRNTAHTPAPPVNPDGLRKMLANFVKPGAFQFRTLGTVAQGPMVVNTRIDRIKFADGVKDLHYIGVFFFQDGKIKEWNDYQVAPDTPVKPGQSL